MTTEDQPLAGPSSIPLYLINGVATIWDAQTAATLHCQYDMSGLRAGTLPGVSQQNGFLGLPMTLMQEETAYLVQQGIAHLIPVRSTGVLPTESAVAQHRQARIARISDLERKGQEEAMRVAEEGKKRFAESGEKAKKKREERARAKAEKEKARLGAGGGGDTSGFDLDPTPTDPSPSSTGNNTSTSFKKQADEDTTTKTTTTTTTAKDLTLTKSPSSSKPSGLGPTPTPSLGSASYTSGHFHTIPSHPPIPPLSLASSVITSLPHPLFPFPSTPRHRALLRTFTDLLARNYRVGLGPRFGGEFLIYPGDYLRYHAHFTSQVIVDDQPILPSELVAWGRLGTGTKKAGLICCTSSEGKGNERGEDGDKGGVEYYSLEWANFG